MKTVCIIALVLLVAGCAANNDSGGAVQGAALASKPAAELEPGHGCVICGQYRFKTWAALPENYNPSTGDAGLDEFLLGCWLHSPPGPYRYMSAPPVIYIPSAPQSFVQNDGLTDQQVIEELTALTDAPGGSPELPGVPELYEWNSYGKCVPVITMLAPGGGIWRRPDAEFFADWYMSDEEATEIDEIFDLSRFFDGAYGATILTNVSSPFGGLATPLPYMGMQLSVPSVPNWVSSYAAVSPEYALSGGYQSFGYGIVQHELLHALGNLDDLYVAFYYKDGSSVGSPLIHPGTMASSFTQPNHYVTGMHKAMQSWVPLIRVKYDTDQLVLRNAGIPGASREYYYLGPQGEIGREFFTIENIGVSPEQPCFSGLYVAHIKLPKRYANEAEQAADLTEPWCAWVASDGREPWQDSGIPYKKPFDQFAYPQQMLFPPVSGSGADDLTADGIPNSRLWDGTDSGIRLLNAKVLDAFSTAGIPSWFTLNLSEGLPGPVSVGVKVGRKLPGDCNRDGIVNLGDLNFIRLNATRHVGADQMLIPLDINGDGQLNPVPDRDGDGVIATSERIYSSNGAFTLDNGDWIDMNRDGRNDLDPDSDGVVDLDAIDKDSDGLFDAGVLKGDVLVWPELDFNGSGRIEEFDASVVGYHWGELAFEELWVEQQPIPVW